VSSGDREIDASARREACVLMAKDQRFSVQVNRRMV
jgi:hypothetical protein